MWRVSSSRAIAGPITAAAILLLQERGKLSVQDDITKHLTDFPTQDKKVTIHNLLTHTSGIPSYTGMKEWIPKMREDMPVDQLIGFFKDKPFEFDPGTQWKYDNSGYVLLGAIIEKASALGSPSWSSFRIPTRSSFSKRSTPR